MAFTKRVQTPHGVFADYHKIIKIELSVVDMAMLVVLAIYASAEARDAGATPMWHEYINVPFDQLPSDPRVDVYDFLGTWTGSWLYGAEKDQRPDPQPEVVEEVETPVFEDDSTHVPGDPLYHG